MLSQLTLDQLRILVCIDDEGSFSAAARRLGRVQSAISHAVQNLEKAQGLVLFDRSGRRPFLTTEGRVIVGHARRVLGQVQTLERVTGAMAAGVEADLAIAIDPFVHVPMIVTLLADLKQEFPDIAITLYTEGIGAAERRVLSGSALIGICTLNPLLPKRVQAFRIDTIEMVPVVASDHPLGLIEGPVPAEALAEHVQLVLTDPNDGSGPSFNVVSPAVWRFVDIGRRLDFLLAGFGWSFMPLYLVQEHLASGQLVKMDVSQANLLLDAVSLFAIHGHDQVPGPAGRWLLSRLQQDSRLTA